MCAAAASARPWTPGPSARWRSALPVFDGGAPARQRRRRAGPATTKPRAPTRQRAAGGARGRGGAGHPAEHQRPRAPTRDDRGRELSRPRSRHRGALPQRPGQPVRAGGRAAQRAGRRRPRWSRCSASAPPPGSPSTAPWAAAGRRPESPGHHGRCRLHRRHEKNAAFTPSSPRWPLVLAWSRGAFWLLRGKRPPHQEEGRAGASRR